MEEGQLLANASRLEGIPLGITNHTDESAAHRIVGNVAALSATNAAPKTFSGLAYLNFSGKKHVVSELAEMAEQVDEAAE